MAIPAPLRPTVAFPDREPRSADRAVPLLALSYRQAADALGVSERTVWQLVRDGRLRAARIGRSVRIAVAELQRYLVAAQSRLGNAGQGTDETIGAPE